MAMTITLTDEKAARLLALLDGAQDEEVTESADVATDGDEWTDADYATDHAIYRGRVNRGKPKSLRMFAAGKRAAGIAPKHPVGTVAPVKAATVAPVKAADADADAIRKIRSRSDCVAVLRTPNGALVGCYRFTRKADDADRFTISGDGAAADAIIGALAAFAV
jgi:hypothetical protein